MADYYRVRVQSINGTLLTCRVTELYGQGLHLVASRTLALGFLWDTTDWFWWLTQHPVRDYNIEPTQTVARATPLGRELAHGSFADDEDWNRENADRFISCVGVVDHFNCDREPNEHTPLEQYPQATYLISVADPRWLEHLAPGMEWESRVWDCDWDVACKPAWRTSDAMLLAKRIQESQGFSAMPILADALQDAGCDCDDILNHLRDPHTAHVRGCWALDQVLGTGQSIGYWARRESDEPERPA